ncbi:MAG TPA: CBS domain-containing protein [Anaerolineales bacterium]|jgi:acetoin utilization protein AcuB|nr:CBS domain-containing protein [Anaerolineales bacterium]
MLVKERMTHPVVVIRPYTPIYDALNLMRKERIRRLPVVDKRGRLVGIVSERDLIHASPSRATSLSIWEANYLLSKVAIHEVMTREVISVSEDTPIEEAARIMADNKIGGLPIVRNAKVVGIITETDLFRAFLGLLGAREPGIRLTVLVPNLPDILAQLIKAISDSGGSILAMGTFLGDCCDNREVTLKVSGVEQQMLVDAIQPYIQRVADARQDLESNISLVATD